MWDYITTLPVYIFGEWGLKHLESDYEMYLGSESADWYSKTKRISYKKELDVPILG